MLERPLECLEWERHYATTCSVNHRERCFDQRLGCPLPGGQHRMAMLTSGERATLKLLGAPSGVSSSKDIFKRSGKVPHPDSHGQCFSSGIYIEIRGTHSFVLNSLTRDLWTWFSANQIHLTAQHVPGVTNYHTDRESRVFQDFSDWKLNPQLFLILNELWGSLDIDLFATRLTKQLLKFVSYKPDIEALGTDAFTLDCSHCNGYAFPPFH